VPLEVGTEKRARSGKRVEEVLAVVRAETPLGRPTRLDDSVLVVEHDERRRCYRDGHGWPRS
jgi:hypothetical protein